MCVIFVIIFFVLVFAGMRVSIQKAFKKTRPRQPNISRVDRQEQKDKMRQIKEDYRRMKADQDQQIRDARAMRNL